MEITRELLEQNGITTVDGEMWKHWRNQYYVSNHARIIYVVRGTEDRVRLLTMHMRGQYLGSSNQWRKFHLHEAVAQCWVPGYAEGLEVDHIDHNKLNNLPSNLRWVTHKENMAANMELRKQRGEFANCLLSPVYVNGKRYYHMLDVARACGVGLHRMNTIITSQKESFLVKKTGKCWICLYHKDGIYLLDPVGQSEELHKVLLSSHKEVVI